MKIIIIRSRAIEPAINKIAKALSQDGHEVKLLLWDRSGNKKTEKVDGYTIIRFGFKAPHDKLTVVFYFPIWWIYEFFFLLKQNSDVIHVCDLDTLIPAIVIKFIKKNKLFYTIYDFYANNLPDGQFQMLRNFIRNLVALVDKYGIGFTDAIHLADESRYELIKGAKIKKLIYLYNTPPDIYYMKNVEESHDKDEIVIFYGGLIVKQRGIEHMIQAIDDLKGIRLIMAGPANDKEIFERIKNGKNVQYLGWIPTYEEILKITSEADILFRFTDPILPLFKFDSPNKLFEAMMLGKPIIVSDGGNMSNIVKKEKCGLVIPYGDIQAIKKALIRLKNDPQLCKELGKNGRKAYDDKYSWKIMEKRLIDTYRIILTE